MDTMVALYDNVSHAQQAAERLASLGIEPQRVTLILQEITAIYKVARETARASNAAERGQEPGAQDTEAYDRDTKVQQGGALVAVQFEADERQQIVAEIEQYGLVDAMTLDSEQLGNIVRSLAPAVHPGDFWIDVEAAFQRHFHANYEAKGYEFDTYEPAYRFGFAMARQPGPEGSDWELVAPQLQEEWTRHFPRDWQQFSAAIEHGWEVARGRRPGQEPDVSEIQTTKRGAQYRQLSEEQ